MISDAPAPKARYSDTLARAYRGGGPRREALRLVRQEGDDELAGQIEDRFGRGRPERAD